MTFITMNVKTMATLVEGTVNDIHTTNVKTMATLVEGTVHDIHYHECENHGNPS